MGPLRFLSCVVVLFSFARIAAGAEFLYPGGSSGTVVLPANQAAKNLYAAGATVDLKGPVSGDLVAAGGQVNISGKVEQDLVAAGGDLRVEKTVGDTARLVGGRISINAPIGGDLIAAGGRLSLDPGASVKGDVAVAGGEIDLEGPIQGRLWAGGGNITLNGAVAGNGVIHYNQSLILGPSCRVKGKLECYGPKPPLSQPGSSAPGLDYHVTEPPPSASSRFTGFFGIFGLIGLVRLSAWLLAAWLLIQILPKPLRAVLGVIHTDPWRDLGLGFVVLAVACVGIPLLFLTGVGYYASLLAAGLLGTGMLLARLLAGFYLGILLRKWVEKGKVETSLPFKWVAIGILSLHLLGLFPLFGWLVSLGITLLALGAMARLAYQNVRLENQKPAGE